MRGRPNWHRPAYRVQMAASILCEDRGHSGRAGESCCGVCFADVKQHLPPTGRLSSSIVLTTALILVVVSILLLPRVLSQMGV